MSHKILGKNYPLLQDLFIFMVCLAFEHRSETIIILV